MIISNGENKINSINRITVIICHTKALSEGGLRKNEIISAGKTESHDI